MNTICISIILKIKLVLLSSSSGLINRNFIPIHLCFRGFLFDSFISAFSFQNRVYICFTYLSMSISFWVKYLHCCFWIFILLLNFWKNTILKLCITLLDIGYNRFLCYSCILKLQYSVVRGFILFCFYLILDLDFLPTMMSSASKNSFIFISSVYDFYCLVTFFWLELPV